jgi:hypothetical protein
MYCTAVFLFVAVMVTISTCAPAETLGISKRSHIDSRYHNACPNPCSVDFEFYLTGTNGLGRLLVEMACTSGATIVTSTYTIEENENYALLNWQPPVPGFYDCIVNIYIDSSHQLIYSHDTSFNDVACSSTCGDPHMRTFDGRPYSFQGICWYTLMTDCSEGKRDFEVTAKFMPRKGVVDETKTRAVALNISVANERISVDLTNEVTVNDQPLAVVTPRFFEIEQVGDDVIITVNINGAAFTVTWSGKKRMLDIKNGSNHGKLCGLLGNADGDPLNDFQKPDGNLVKDIDEFGQSWRVPGISCE